MDWDNLKNTTLATKITLAGAIVAVSVGGWWFVKRQNSDVIHVSSESPTQEKPRDVRYTTLTPELIDFIVQTGYSVTEVCAGNGYNAQLLRERNVCVHAYDIKSIQGKVSYGLNGLVEQLNDDNILLINAGFDCERSIDNFRGNIVIVGGYVVADSEDTKSQREILVSLSHPQPVTFQPFEILYKLELRPSFQRMIDLGWKFHRFFPGCRSNSMARLDVFYVFIRTDPFTKM